MYYYNYIDTGMVEKNIVINRLFTTTRLRTMIQYVYIYNPTNEIRITERVVCILYYENIIVYQILQIRELYGT